MSGTAAVVSAAFGTPLEIGAAPNEARALVNTASPQVPASLAGVVTGVVGPRRPVPGALHAAAQAAARLGTGATPRALAQRRQCTSSANPGSAGRAAEPRRVAHASTPQACPAAAATAAGGTTPRRRWPPSSGWTSCSTRAAPASARRSPSWSSSSTSGATSRRSSPATGCPTPSATCSSTAAPPGPPTGPGEAALDIELASFNAPSAVPHRLRGAERQRRRGPRPVQPHRQRRHGPGRHDELGQLRGRPLPATIGDREHDLLSAWRCRGRP